MRFFTIGLLLALTGCATQNAPGISAYQPVPYERVIATPKEPLPEERPGTIIVKRDPGLMGAALSSILLLNGKPIARVKPGEYFQFDISTGEHLFGVSWSDNLGAVATSSTREVAVVIHPGKTYYLRMFPQPGSGIAIERSSQ